MATLAGCEHLVGANSADSLRRISGQEMTERSTRVCSNTGGGTALPPRSDDASTGCSSNSTIRRSDRRAPTRQRPRSGGH